MRQRYRLLRFPRLYAAASLKRPARSTGDTTMTGFPRLYAAASLKREMPSGERTAIEYVFRGFMPRPH